MLVSWKATALSLVKPKSISPSSDYRPDIDGLRAVAILLVIGFHAVPEFVPGGFCGVDIFFVISGFLITGILLDKLSSGKYSIVDFYIRRIRRLFPALITVFFIVWLLGRLIFLPDEFRQLGKDIAAGAGFSLNLILYKNVVQYFGGPDPLIHLWSLGIEEQFYLLWPIFLAAAWRLKSHYLISIVVCITVISFASNAAVVSRNLLASFYLPWNRLWELSLGGMIAYAEIRYGKSNIFDLPVMQRSVWIWWRLYGLHVQGLIGTALLILAFTKLNSALDYPGCWALIPAIGAATLLAAGRNSFVNRYLLSQPSMIFVGLISYPLYLWHWPLLYFSGIIAEQQPAHLSMFIFVSIVASFVLAFITYRYIELPIRYSNYKVMTAAGLAFVMLLCGGVGYLTFRQYIPARRLPLDVADYARAAAEDFKPWTPHQERLLELGNGTQKVLFIGDSLMQQYYSRIGKLLRDHPENMHGAVFATRGACSPSGFGRIYGGDACRRHVQNTILYANRPSVDRIVIGAAWFGYFVDFKDNRYTLASNADIELAILKKIIIGFTQNKKRVYLVLQSPMSEELSPRRMIHRTLIGPGFKLVPAPPPSRKKIEASFSPIISKLTELSKVTGVHVIDPMESLCLQTVCPNISEAGKPIYIDGGHLRPSYVQDHIHFLDKVILDSQPSAVVKHTPGM